ncbi:hypothetical protein L841_3178 [Mycobacterium sp. MAC_080597_8934]|uniref:hypothetical protein n=1 Tax=unclassified Mycobacterium avium complex (MAC) TaxID=2750822 RepID=UPI0004475F31|nr:MULTISPECIES: hypothetical protein [unclassified Mycobacterium avium complex (MAC)]ETZ56998.1 hypothetical protein L840_3385 [Mycobacterium sp. MAC_011194_8550]ETZ66928.1 hypothetical protein L841_3178 [Mycobacterium sp. MAC_080597_8934]
MGFVDAQIAELVAVVDELVGPSTDAVRPGFNGSHGLVRAAVDVAPDFHGAASKSWQAAHESAAAQQARLSEGDQAVGALLAAVHERAIQTQRQLAAIRTDLLALKARDLSETQTRAEKIETVDFVQAKARELQKLTHEAQRFSGEMAGKLRAAAAGYSTQGTA